MYGTRADPRQFVLGGEDGHMKNHPHPTHMQPLELMELGGIGW
jgi:hypothetical protein